MDDAAKGVGESPRLTARHAACEVALRLSCVPLRSSRSSLRPSVHARNESSATLRNPLRGGAGLRQWALMRRQLR